MKQRLSSFRKLLDISLCVSVTGELDMSDRTSMMCVTDLFYRVNKMVYASIDEAPLHCNSKTSCVLEYSKFQTIRHVSIKTLNSRVSLYPVTLYPGMTAFPESISRDFPGFGIFNISSNLSFFCLRHWGFTHFILHF